MRAFSWLRQSNFLAIRQIFGVRLKMVGIARILGLNSVVYVTVFRF